MTNKFIIIFYICKMIQNKFNFKPFPILNTERLVLRKLGKNDTKEIFFLRSNEIVIQYIEKEPLQSVDEATLFIHKINQFINNNESITWGIELDNKMIGTICLWNFSPDNTIADIGYDLHPNFHQQGIMSEAIKKVLDFGFNVLGFEHIEAYTHQKNIASIQLLKKHHFNLFLDKKDEGFPNNIIFNLDKILFNNF